MIDKEIIAVVPSYQPDKQLPGLIYRITELKNISKVVVVDDGSGKEYDYIFSEIEKIKGVTVLQHAINLGKGAGIKTAFNYILCESEKNQTPLIGAVTVDADGQHLPEDLDNVSQEFCSSPESFVLGVRDFHKEKQNIPFRSRFGNLCTEYIFALFAGKRIIDTQTGLRVYPVNLMKEVLEIKNNRYELELEALLISCNKGYNIIQKPITTVYENNNESSHFNPLLDSLKIYFVFFRFVSASIICSLIDYVVFSTIILFGGSIFLSLAIARIISLTVNFILVKNLVFHSSGSVLAQMAKFLLLALFLVSSSYVSIQACKEHLGISPLISKIIVESLLFLISFATQKIFIFYNKQIEQ